MDSAFWILPDRLAGRPGPDRNPWNLEALRGSVDVIVNLSEFEPPIEALESLGFQSLWQPLPTAVPPDVEAERRCEAHLPDVERYVHTHLLANRRVLVHCVAGKDRTGMLLAYHLARREAIDAQEALRRVRVVRPEALSAEGWEPMALRLMARLLDSA